ncbi:hypothetical protein J3R83DRAFT_13352 [Lanmaoa asiatica]|nr:hypothetical protein J3R83DRAFT_13352 [Lanmaoa asiatica]
MAYPKSVDETVWAMAQQTSTTLGWDVVVNYTESDINSLLSETFKDKSKEQITELQCEVTTLDPISAQYIIIHYDFKLAAPLLTFNSRSAQGPSCNLTLPIVGGTVRAEGGNPVTIYPRRYSLVLGTLKLATAKGAADPVPTPYDKPFVIPDKGQGCVVIDLPTSKDLTVNIDIDNSDPSVPPIPTIDVYKAMVRDAILELLHVRYKHIRYEIARVKAIPPPSGTIQLKPKSFRFDAFLPSESPKPDDAGVLTLFIQTRDTNYGRENELATKWESQWRTDLTCSPIPRDQTASIIFSKDMIFETVIKPALKVANFEGTLKDSVGSLQVGIETGKKVRRGELDTIKKSVRYNVSPVSMDLPPLTLLLKEVRERGVSLFITLAHGRDPQHAGSATYAISWEFKYDCEWVIQVIIYPYPDPRYGTVTATHTVPKDAAKPAQVVEFLDDHSFKLKCSISKDDWGAKFSSSKASDWEEWVEESGMLPEMATSLALDVPTFELQLQSVDFFLTTNLLFPDDKQVIDVDTKSGLHIPADLYLVGKVKTK